MPEVAFPPLVFSVTSAEPELPDWILHPPPFPVAVTFPDVALPPSVFPETTARVERLDRVGAVDHAADLDVVVQGRYELALSVLPELVDRRILLAPLRVELHKALAGSCL